MSESTKCTVTIFTIIVSLLPCLFLLHFPETVNVMSVALWGSAVVGYMGIVMLLWMYILGTKGVMSMIYCDLAPVLRIHKWLGKYGSIAVFLHPILITISYGESWLYPLIPKFETLSQRHIVLGQIALLLLVTTWAISFFLRKKLTFRGWKYTHYLAYICVPFALLHVPDLGSQEQRYLPVKAYLFLLGATYLVFLGLRVRSLLNLDRSKYQLVRHMKLTDVDYLMQLQPLGRRLTPPRRGQYVYIKLGFLSEDHPFSVTQYDDTTGVITLTYRLSGMYTKELAMLTEGQPVLLSGPYGSFMQDLTPENSMPVVYIAGGIGITPFVDRILKESTTREQWLFAANRSKSLAVLYEPLRQTLGARAVGVFGSPDDVLGPNEERGFLTADLLKKYLSEPAKYHFYLCGPPPMMKAVRGVAAELGVPAAHIHTEEFGW